MLKAVNGTAEAGGGNETECIPPEPDVNQNVNDGAEGSVEVLEVTSPSGTSFVPVPSLMEDVQASPSTIVVSYDIGPNGSLIPVYDSCFLRASLGNTFMFVTEGPPPPEPISKPAIPPHLVDHTYAKNFKEPRKKTIAKKKSKAGLSRKKPSPLPPPPPQRPSVKALKIADNTSVNNPKINIMRMDLPPKEFEFVHLSHPLILNHFGKP